MVEGYQYPGGRMMIDLIFLIAIIIFNLIVAQIAFVVFRYFILRRQGHYEDKIAILNDQLKNDKISKPLFNQEKQRLREEYHVRFYEKWWGNK